MFDFKGLNFERDTIRWYVACPMSYRPLEEMMKEHDVYHLIDLLNLALAAGLRGSSSDPITK
jgi:transposase-like protein